MAESVDDGGRGARLASRDEGAYCGPVNEEQRFQAVASTTKAKHFVVVGPVLSPGPPNVAPTLRRVASRSSCSCGARDPWLRTDAFAHATSAPARFRASS